MEFLLFLSLKLLYFMSLNDFIRLYFDSFLLYFKRSLFYLLFFIFVTLIFTSISFILFGSSIKDSSSYNYSYLNLLLCTIGGLDLNKWQEVDEFWGVLFIITYYLFLLFFSYIVFMSIFLEALRNIINKEGYPSDEVSDNWTTYDYLRWLFFCLKIDESRIQTK